MRRGTCPKCGNANIHCARGGAHWHGASTTGQFRVRTGTQVPGDEVASVVDTYVCTACGFVEQYLMSAEAISAIAATWSYLPPQS